MMKNFFTIIFLISSICFSQNIKISSIEKVEIDQYSSAFYPQFSKDDENIIFTSENYKGLFSHNLRSNQTKIISDENGVGYKPVLIDEENYVLRNFNFEKGRKVHSVYLKNINSEKIEIIETSKRQIKIPNQIIGSELLIVENSTVNKKTILHDKFLKTNQTSKAIFSENDNLFLIQNDEIKNISPLGKGVYVWESLSNDGEKIIFTFGNQGSFVCDLEGNILLNIKDAHYPKFSPDDKFILFMKDKDDGQKYISSDLFIYSIEENKEYQITNTENMIEIFADWSNDQTSIVYNTILGEIYLAKISFEN
ncbi:MAG: PD40 domain-containing protein [Ignavibacteriae bacterium]|nr:PD40 domain-containing protein [Ignavibacteriota bacterium]